MRRLLGILALAALPLPLSAGTSPASDYYTVAPCRLIDTRNPVGPLGGPALASGATRAFTVTGVCGIPAGTATVAINITVVGSASDGYLTLWPSGAPWPGIAEITMAGPTAALSAFALVPLAANGAMDAFLLQRASGTAHLVVDVVGYFD